MAIPRRKSPKLSPRSWYVRIRVTDTPEEGEDYLTQEEIRGLLTGGQWEAGADAEILNIDLEPTAAKER